MKNSLYHQAKIAAQRDEMPSRYKFITLKKPWYWFFLFWSSRWNDYGKLVRVDEDDGEYEQSPFGLKYVYPDHPTDSPVLLTKRIK